MPRSSSACADEQLHRLLLSEEEESVGDGGEVLDMSRAVEIMVRERSRAARSVERRAFRAASSETRDSRRVSWAVTRAAMEESWARRQAVRVVASSSSSSQADFSERREWCLLLRVVYAACRAGRVVVEVRFRKGSGVFIVGGLDGVPLFVKKEKREVVAVVLDVRFGEVIFVVVGDGGLIGIPTETGAELPVNQLLNPPLFRSSIFTIPPRSPVNVAMKSSSSSF